MNTRHKRVVVALICATLALGGSAGVLPLGSHAGHPVPAAAVASLVLAVAGFICLVIAVAAAIGYGGVAER